MKAAQISAYGHAEVVKIVDIDKPRIADDQVLVEVRASSINPIDTTVREGGMQQWVPLTLPITLGGDLAGVVSQIGSNTQGFAVGQKVYGQGGVLTDGSGAFAEFAAASANRLSSMPDTSSFAEAAALPLTGVSALQVLTHHMKLQAGQKILIHGGAGGIGTIAIQIAKHLGAHVTATATDEGVDYVKQLGAEQVIDYKKQAFEEGLAGFDAVFDTVGGDTYERSFKVLKKGGVLVSMTVQPNTLLMEKYSVTAIAQKTDVNAKDLAELAKLVNEKVITPHVDATYPLDKIAEAFAARESGKVRGKAIIQIKA